MMTIRRLVDGLLTDRGEFTGKLHTIRETQARHFEYRAFDRTGVTTSL